MTIVILLLGVIVIQLHTIIKYCKLTYENNIGKSSYIKLLIRYHKVLRENTRLKLRYKGYK